MSGRPHAAGRGIGILRPAAGVRHASQDVCRFREHAGRHRPGGRDLRRRAARRCEHAPARAGGARGADRGGGCRSCSAWRCSSATRNQPSTRISPGPRKSPRSSPRRVPGRVTRRTIARRWSSRESITFRSSPRTSRDGSRRRLPKRVSRRVESLGADRGLVAADLDCALTGAYYDRFVQAMSDHTGSNATPPPDAAAKSDRYYLAQCVKDETMGESIAAAVRPTDRHVTLVHYNGSFHIDFGQGTVAKARRRLPGRRLVVVSILPVERSRPRVGPTTRISPAPTIWSTR